MALFRTSILLSQKCAKGIPQPVSGQAFSAFMDMVESPARKMRVFLERMENAEPIRAASISGMINLYRNTNVFGIL
jgi:hypothetical protein